MLFILKMILTFDLSNIARSSLKAGVIPSWNSTASMEGTANLLKQGRDVKSLRGRGLFWHKSYLGT